jgi:hypothetical protein
MSEGVASSVELLVSIIEPRLGVRGSLIGARITCDPPETLSSSEARRLGDALARAAALADEADRKLLPILESYSEVRGGLLNEATA